MTVFISWWVLWLLLLGFSLVVGSGYRIGVLRGRQALLDEAARFAAGRFNKTPPPRQWRSR